MIACENCKISFSPDHRVCPQCGAFEVPFHTVTEYLMEMARIDLAAEGKLADVESRFRRAGLNEEETLQLVSRLPSVIRDRRVRAVKRISVGCIFIFAGVMFVGQTRQALMMAVGAMYVIAGISLLKRGVRLILHVSEV